MFFIVLVRTVIRNNPIEIKCQAQSLLTGIVYLLMPHHAG